MAIEIKKATMNDLERVRALNQELFNHDSMFDETLNLNWPSENEKYFKNSIESKNKVTFVAISEGQVVGYLIGLIKKLESDRKIKEAAEIENMLVSEKFRGLGVGTKLVNNFLEWAKLKGIKRKLVMAYAKNSEAISFYKKNGFSEYALTLEGDI